MFSRRVIQTLIDEAAVTMDHEHLSALVERLNLIDQGAIEATWELIWIANLAGCGKVAHEPQLPGATRFPDIHFQARGLEFIADIATVSDAGYEKENPVEELCEELDRLYVKHGVLGGFEIKVQSTQVGPYRNNRVKLLLPSRAEITGFVLKHFEAFIRAVALAPDKSATTQAAVPTGGTIQLNYNPAQRPYNYGGGHLSFDVPYSLQRNPIYNTLKAKKRQLAGSGFSGLQGIILCDGGCSVLTMKMHRPSSFTLDEIIRDFLRQNTSVGFVLTVGVTETASLGSQRRVHKLIPNFYVQSGLDPDEEQALSQVLGSAVEKIPSIKRTPLNARYRLAKGSPTPAQFSDSLGRWSFSLGNPMQKTEITISARSLTALLGGEIDLEKFRTLHRLPTNTGTRATAPFDRVLAEGRKLESISLQKEEGEDDDSVVLCFGPSDPAKVKYRTLNEK